MRRLNLIIFGLYFLLSPELWARPESLEVWLLHEIPQKSLLERKGDSSSMTFPLGSYWALNETQDHSACRFVGESFYHHLYGFHQHYNYKDAPFYPLMQSRRVDPWNLFSIENPERVNEENHACSQGLNDIGCAHQPPESDKQVSLEIWVDTSSSLQKVDPIVPEFGCFRQRFLQKMRNKCTHDGIRVFSMDTSFRLLRDEEDACRNFGLNDTNLLISWIETSTVKKLIIISDPSIVEAELVEYLESINAKIVGAHPQENILARDLDSLVEYTSLNCRQD